MIDLIQHVYILKLEKNDGQEIENNIKQLFPGKKIYVHEVEGCKKSNRNEGSINLSFWKILNHSYVDDIAKDITKNHIDMIRKAFMDNLDFVLFVEEDSRIETQKLINEKCKRVNQWMLKRRNKWDIFYLGYCNWPVLFSFLITPDVVRIYTPLAAHCYILNRHGMQKILNYTENGNKNMEIHIDKMFATIPSFRKYGIFPMIAFQKNNPALFTKACDKINMNISMKSASIVIQYCSIILPILLILITTLLFIKLFWKKGITHTAA